MEVDRGWKRKKSGNENLITLLCMILSSVLLFFALITFIIMLIISSQDCWGADWKWECEFHYI